MNAPFEPARTPFDWLSRDSMVVDEFIHDPLCFAALSPQPAHRFSGCGPTLYPASLRILRPDLPVYLFSGSRDPVGQQLEGIQVLIERYSR